MSEKETLKKLFGAEYFEPGETATLESPDDDLYHYKAYIGKHTVEVERGDCCYWVSDDMTEAFITRGPATVETTRLATVIRGYKPENKSSSIVTRTNLPYVNGCSTKQVFPPDRIGDPTLQILDIPPYSAEQAHHVHSTARVVIVLRGTGRSIVGMEQKTITEDLYEGKVVILHKFSPHHFETDGEHLLVLPLHVFSSSGPIESNHPMFNGTHLT